jgi:23S rRNA pseudouridine1911/1915/1917 synthase
MTQRTLVVGRAEAGRRLADWLREKLRLPPENVLRLLRTGQVRIAREPCTDPSRRVRPGQRIEVRIQKQKPKRRSERKPAGPSLPAAALRYADEQVVVVDKPAGLTTMRHASDVAEFGDRARRYLPPTLADLLPGALARAGHSARKVRAVHRLDKDTSGLVVFARTPGAEGNLGRQFRAHSTERVYLALVRGRARDARLESWLVDDRGDGRRGSGPPGAGQHAVTHVHVVEELGEYTLVECRLETGRTHQVRIHLGEAGTPLCGERVYDRPLHGRPLPDHSGATRVLLHAAVLGFDHPATGERVRWTSPPPPDMQAVLDRLRR